LAGELLITPIGSACASTHGTNAFYNALKAFNSGEIFRQLGSFCILVAFAIAMSVYALYLNQTRRYAGGDG
jgi:ABC-type uncharacterized transport system fused permease/ATPase subunit